MSIFDLNDKVIQNARINQIISHVYTQTHAYNPREQHTVPGCARRHRRSPGSRIHPASSGGSRRGWVARIHERTGHSIHVFAFGSRVVGRWRRLRVALTGNRDAIDVGGHTFIQPPGEIGSPGRGASRATHTHIPHRERSGGGWIRQRESFAPSRCTYYIPRAFALSRAAFVFRKLLGACRGEDWVFDFSRSASSCYFWWWT